MDGRRRQNIVIIAGVAVAFIAALVGIAIWELGYDCVRWSTRIDVHDNEAVTYTRVCAEYQLRWPVRDE